MEHEGSRPVPVQGQTALFIGPNPANKDNLTSSKFPVDGARDCKVVVDNPPGMKSTKAAAIQIPDRTTSQRAPEMRQNPDGGLQSKFPRFKGLGNKSPRAGHLKGAIFDNYPDVLVPSTWKCRLARGLSL